MSVSRLDPKDSILTGLAVVVVFSIIPAGYFGRFDFTGIKGASSLKTDSLELCAFAFLFVSAQTVARFLINPIGRTLVPRRQSWSREVWIAKVDRFSVAAFKLVFNCAAVGILYYLVWNAKWLPHSLGGSGSTAECWSIDSELTDLLRHFYLSSLGFVLADIIVHAAVERGRPDFLELILHLIVTFILLSVSYIAGFSRLGILVIMSHLICDIFVYSAKSLVDTKFSGGALAYIPLLFVHVWFRLFVFGTTILRSILVEAPKSIGDLTIIWAYVSVMLSLSLLIHTYWGFVIFKIGLLLLTTGQSRDLQANLSSMDVRNFLDDSRTASNASLANKKIL